MTLSESQALGAMQKAQSAIQDFTRKYDVASKLKSLGIQPKETPPPCLAKMPHPKHKGETAYEGTGIYFAVKAVPGKPEVLKGKALEDTLASDLFSAIDTGINDSKKAGDRPGGECAFTPGSPTGG